MKKSVIFFSIFIILIISGFSIFFFLRNRSVKNEEKKIGDIRLTTSMHLSSPAFSHNQSIPQKYTCDGENINPPLEIRDIPENSQSLVLIVDDPDAPRGTWVHWTIWNISPHIKEIKEGVRPDGVEGLTSFGKPGYGGPCPPIGTHRYFFKIFALDTTLDFPDNTSATKIEDAMTGHILDTTELIGLYNRSK